MANARPTSVKAKMPARASLHYQSGCGSEFGSEAVEGVLPRGENSPQKVAHGLYAEQLSGTAFTAPRGVNRRTWLYRMRPSVAHRPFEPISPGRLRSAPFDEIPTPPTQFGSAPIPIPAPAQVTHFVRAPITMAGHGDNHTKVGLATHIYAGHAPTTDLVFYNG